MTAENLPALSTNDVEVFLDDYEEFTKCDLKDSLKSIVMEHLFHAIEEGYLKAEYFEGKLETIQRLTLKGHHFVAATREDHIWDIYVKNASSLHCAGSIEAIFILINKRVTTGKW